MVKKHANTMVAACKHNVLLILGYFISSEFNMYNLELNINKG